MCSHQYIYVKIFKKKHMLAKPDTISHFRVRVNLYLKAHPMKKTIPFHPSDFRGAGRLAVDAVTGLTETVERMHHNISRFPLIFGRPTNERMGGISGLVYSCIRGVTHVVGGAIDLAGRHFIEPLVPMTAEKTAAPPARDALLAVLNGVLGDYMEKTGNPMAIQMRFRLHGRPLETGKQALAEAIPAPQNKLLVLIHGLCMNDRKWHRNGHDHGAALARDLGYSSVYLHYNSGRHVSENGQTLAAMLDELTRNWPVALEAVSFLGHSMGGLVARSACHYGAASGHGWVKKLEKIVFLGTPHHGTRLERNGNRLEYALGLSPYSAALARLGSIRSAGITDLRYGSVTHGDLAGADRFKHCRDARIPVPLPDNTMCCAIAASKRKQGDRLGRFLDSDGLVPMDSALGRHKNPAYHLGIPASRQWVKYGINHFDLLSHPEVYETIRGFME